MCVRQHVIVVWKQCGGWGVGDKGATRLVNTTAPPHHHYKQHSGNKQALPSEGCLVLWTRTLCGL